VSRPSGDSLLTLHRVPPGYRVLYTGVLLFFVAGYGAGLAQQALRSGLSPAGIAHWYLGNADAPRAGRLLFAMPPARLLDEVWRRSLADAVPVLVLLALLFRAGIPARARWGLGAWLTGTALVDMAAPALVGGLGAAAAVPAFAAQVGLAAGAALSSAVCLRDLWLRQRAGPRVRARARPGQDGPSGRPVRPAEGP